MKNKDIISLPDAELMEMLKTEKAALNKMTLNHAISPVEKPSVIRDNRRNVARMVTEVSKRKNASTK
jgi:large subunit ribosomal protein L29